ncbi:MAG: hypothetical protein STHCBS139747_003481 [Sporothrix thermara]
MTAPSTALVATLALLVADATIELGFITSMVDYLHAGAPSGTFVVNTPPEVLSQPALDAAPTYLLQGKPLHVFINQGHTSNGAAGSAIVLIGIVGAIALAARHWAPANRLGRALYYVWMCLQVPTLLLTLSALSYTMAAVRAHSGQTIDQTVAYTTQPGPYALDTWTPQNWFAAVLELDLADAALRSNVAMHLRIMRGWQYNLIPLFIVQLLETAAAIADFCAWLALASNRNVRSVRGGGKSMLQGSAGEKYYPGSTEYGGSGSGGVQEPFMAQPADSGMDPQGADNGYGQHAPPQQQQPYGQV